MTLFTQVDGEQHEEQHEQPPFTTFRGRLFGRPRAHRRGALSLLCRPLKNPALDSTSGTGRPGPGRFRPRLRRVLPPQQVIYLTM